MVDAMYLVGFGFSMLVLHDTAAYRTDAKAMRRMVAA